MNLSPWDYWEAGGTRPKGRPAEIVATLERVLAARSRPSGCDPLLHPRGGSLVEAGARGAATPSGWGTPCRARAISCTCRRTSTIASAAISTRSTANKRAVAADEALLRAAPARRRRLPLRLLPAQHPLPARLGADGGRRRHRDRGGREARALALDEVTREVPWVQPIMAAPYFAHAQFSDAATILALPAPKPAASRTSTRCGTTRAASRMPRAATSPRRNGRSSTRSRSSSVRPSSMPLAAAGVPARRRAAPRAARARRAGGASARPRFGEAMAELRQARRRCEDALALHGAAVLVLPGAPVARRRAGARGPARCAPRTCSAQSLGRTPNNGWALYGLVEVYERRGDAGAARRGEAALRPGLGGVAGCACSCAAIVAMVFAFFFPARAGPAPTARARRAAADRPARPTRGDPKAPLDVYAGRAPAYRELQKGAVPMSLHDRRGNPVSAATPAALAQYERAADLFLGFSAKAARRGGSCGRRRPRLRDGALPEGGTRRDRQREDVRAAGPARRRGGGAARRRREPARARRTSPRCGRSSTASGARRTRSTARS